MSLVNVELECVGEKCEDDGEYEDIDKLESSFK